MTELCDESRFAKNLTATLARVGPLAGDGLFTSFHGEPNWQRAHDVLLPGFSYAGVRAHHAAMLDINTALIDRWDARAGVEAVDVSTGLQKLAMNTVALAGFGSRFDFFRLPVSGYDDIGKLTTSRTSGPADLAGCVTNDS